MRRRSPDAALLIRGPTSQPPLVLGFLRFLGSLGSLGSLGFAVLGSAEQCEGALRRVRDTATWPARSRDRQGRSVIRDVFGRVLFSSHLLYFRHFLSSPTEMTATATMATGRLTRTVENVPAEHALSRLDGPEPGA